MQHISSPSGIAKSCSLVQYKWTGCLKINMRKLTEQNTITSCLSWQKCLSCSCFCAVLILSLICVHDNVTRAAIRGSTERTEQCSSIDNSAGRHMTPGAGQGDTRCRLRKTARSASHVSRWRDGDSNLLSLKYVFQSFVWISEQTAIISLNNINWLVCITET